MAILLINSIAPPTTAGPPVLKLAPKRGRTLGSRSTSIESARADLGCLHSLRLNWLQQLLLFWNPVVRLFMHPPRNRRAAKRLNHFALAAGFLGADFERFLATCLNGIPDVYGVFPPPPGKCLTEVLMMASHATLDSTASPALNQCLAFRGIQARLIERRSVGSVRRGHSNCAKPVLVHFPPINQPRRWDYRPISLLLPTRHHATDRHRCNSVAALGVADKNFVRRVGTDVICERRTRDYPHTEQSTESYRMFHGRLSRRVYKQLGNRNESSRRTGSTRRRRLRRRGCRCSGVGLRLRRWRARRPKVVGWRVVRRHTTLSH